MADIHAAYERLIERVLQGSGVSPAPQRRAAFDDEHAEGPLGVLLHKVAEAAHTVSDADIAAARSADCSEDQLFELIVCAAIGQASRQYQAARAALAASNKER